MKYNYPILCTSIFLIQLLFFSARSINGQDRNLLSNRYDISYIENNISSLEDYKPFPSAGSDKWNIIPKDHREKIISRAESLLDYDYPVLRASEYMDFVRSGNRSRFQKVYSERRKVIGNLVMAEIIENEGRFLDDIINGVWAICEETSWVIPAHIKDQEAGAGLPDITEPITGIFASETPSLLAAVEYFLGDKLDEVNPLIRERIEYEVRHRFLNVMMERDDLWWMGYNGSFTNNWNPWVVSNYINVILIFEKEQKSRAEALYRAMDILDNFFNIYPDDGGCDEGPAYWNHAGGRAFNCLELLYNASDGAIDIFDEPLIRNMGDYLWKVYINDNWFVNFADAPAKMTPHYFVAYRYGKMTGSEQLMSFSKLFFDINESPVPSGNYFMLRTLPAWFTLSELKNYKAEFNYSEYEVLLDLELFLAREFNNPEKGFFVAAKGGYNAESHNHNDAGSYILYLDGEPLLVDAGVGEYTAKTFSSRRYEIWTMQSSYHNLPDINGKAQPYGEQYKATAFNTSNSKNRAKVQIALSKAYPEEAALSSYVRTMSLDRKRNRFELEESLSFTKDDNTVSFHFLTNHIPETETGKVVLIDPGTKLKRAVIKADKSLEISVETIPLEDSKLQRAWPDKLYRISFKQKNLAGKAKFSFSVE